MRLLARPSVDWPLSRLLLIPSRLSGLLLFPSGLPWLLTGLLRILGLLLGFVREGRLVTSVSKQWLIRGAWFQSARRLNELTLLVVLRTLRIILRFAAKHWLCFVSSLWHPWFRFRALSILGFRLWIFLTFSTPCPWDPLLLVVLVSCPLFLLVEVWAMVPDNIIHLFRLVVDDFPRVAVLGLSDVVGLV